VGLKLDSQTSFTGGTLVGVTDRRTDETPEQRRHDVAAIADAHGGVYDGLDLIEKGACRAEGP